MLFTICTIDARKISSLVPQIELGGGHTQEVPFVFGNVGSVNVATVLNASPREISLSGTMLNAWATFAKTG